MKIKVFIHLEEWVYCCVHIADNFDFPLFGCALHGGKNWHCFYDYIEDLT